MCQHVCASAWKITSTGRHTLAFETRKYSTTAEDGMWLTKWQRNWKRSHKHKQFVIQQKTDWLPPQKLSGNAMEGWRIDHAHGPDDAYSVTVRVKWREGGREGAERQRQTETGRDTERETESGWLCCLTSAEARRHIRDGLRDTETERVRLSQPTYCLQVLKTFKNNAAGTHSLELTYKIWNYN